MMSEQRRAIGFSHIWIPLPTHVHRTPRSGCGNAADLLEGQSGSKNSRHGGRGARQRCAHEQRIDTRAVPDSEPGCDGAGSQYEPYLGQSKYLADKLFCRITGRYVAKTEAAVVRHSEGRRFNTGVGAPIRALRDFLGFFGRNAQLPSGRVKGWRACPHAQAGCSTRGRHQLPQGSSTYLLPWLCSTSKLPARRLIRDCRALAGRRGGQRWRQDDGGEEPRGGQGG